MAGKSKQSLAQVQKTQQRQSTIIGKLKKKEHWMQWAIIAAGILILLLLLLLGYATDWTRGLRKDSVSTATPLNSTLDSLKAANGTATEASTGGGTNGNGGGGGSNGSDGSNGSNGGGTNSSTTERSSTSTNNSTTTNNNTSTTPGTQPSGGLLDLYTNSTAGDNIDDILDRAAELGLDVQCDDGLVVVNCTINQDGKAVSVKSLKLTGIVTSVLKDFEI